MILNWFETLLSYTFQIVHLPGLLNVIPDLLSRIFSEESSATAASVEPVEPSSNVSIPEALALPTSNTPSSTPSKDLRLPILEKAHLAGHFGWNALYNTIRLQQLNWPNLASDCQEVT